MKCSDTDLRSHCGGGIGKSGQCVDISVEVRKEFFDPFICVYDLRWEWGGLFKVWFGLAVNRFIYYQLFKLS